MITVIEGYLVSEAPAEGWYSVVRRTPFDGAEAAVFYIKKASRNLLKADSDYGRVFSPAEGWFVCPCDTYNPYGWHMEPDERVPEEIRRSWSSWVS